MKLKAKIIIVVSITILITAVTLILSSEKLPTDKTFIFEPKKLTVMLNTKEVIKIYPEVLWSICNSDSFSDIFSEFNERKVKERIYEPLSLHLRIKAAINKTSNGIIYYTDEIKKEVQKDVDNIGICIDGLKIITL